MSLRAHLFTWFLKRQFAKPAAGEFSVEGMRRTMGSMRSPLPRGTKREDAIVGGVSGEWVRGAASSERRRLLYIHGGGFIACSPATHRPITGDFARQGFEVFAPDYALAPEHPFPAGLDDVFAVYRSLVAEGPVALAGDSAGGNLALALVARVRAAGLPQPSAVALFSPAIDLVGTGASHADNAGRDVLLQADGLRKLVPLYLGGADPADPLASPLYADCNGMPPLLLHVGEREILRDDSVRLAEKVRRAGGTVALKVYPVVQHVWQLMPRFLPEARDSLDLASAFLRQHVDASRVTAADLRPVVAER